MAEDNLELKNVERLSRLEKEIVPKTIEALGEDAENVRFEIKPLTDSFGISIIYTVDLRYRRKNKIQDERIKLFVKMPSEDESTRAFYKVDYSFHNEIVFYQRFGKNYDDYPKCMYVVSEPIAKAVIVVQNITQLGYTIMQPKEDLGMQRALAAVREIAKFHARGYILKEKDPKEFFGIASELLENRFDDLGHPAMNEFVTGTIQRPINYLRSVNYDPEFCDKISAFFSDVHNKIFKDCVKPKNELAVLCHGDFTSCNALFKEDENGKFDVMLIDFAQFRYTSPATDISSFIYLSCEKAVQRNFPIIFRAYHDAVLEYLKQHGIQNLEKYSFNAFLEDYKRHALIGCVMALIQTQIYHLGHLPSPDDCVKNVSKVVEKLTNAGGEEVSKNLADMLLEFRKDGYLDHMM